MTSRLAGLTEGPWMKLTDEEVQTLQDLWNHRETVNWAVYDRLKDKILRGPRAKPAPHGGAAAAAGNAGGEAPAQ